MASFKFQDIRAWQKAHEFTKLVYEITKDFPEDEKYGLTFQFRRAAISIGANIAEGYKKLSKADKLRFLNIAQGSLEECRNYIILSRDLGFVSSEQFNTLVQSIETASKLLNGYCKGIIDNNGVKEEDIDICHNSLTP